MDNKESFQLFQFPQSFDDCLFACLLQLPGKYELIQYQIDLVEIKYQIQLADVAEEMI